MVICDYRTLVKSFICRSQWPCDLRRGSMTTRFKAWVCGRAVKGVGLWPRGLRRGSVAARLLGL
jgi:hypothetical protein